MDKFLKDVGEFHELFKAPVLKSPQIPSDDRCVLRVSLIQEELDEFREGIKNNDIVEVADSLTDILVVTLGSFHEFGLGPKLEKLFSEVHRSNMSKSCSSFEEAELTQQHYLKKDGTESYLEERDGKWFVYRSVDDKSLKSINYSPADLKSILYGSN